MTSLAVGVPLTIVTVLGLLLNGYILVVVVLTKQVHTSRFVFSCPFYVISFMIFFSLISPSFTSFLSFLFSSFLICKNMYIKREKIVEYPR